MTRPYNVSNLGTHPWTYTTPTHSTPPPLSRGQLNLPLETRVHVSHIHEHDHSLTHSLAHSHTHSFSLRETVKGLQTLVSCAAVNTRSLSSLEPESTHHHSKVDHNNTSHNGANTTLRYRRNFASHSNVKVFFVLLHVARRSRTLRHSRGKTDHPRRVARGQCCTEHRRAYPKTRA